MEHVKGRKKGDLKLYTLSTCIWCRKTKELLKEMGVDFSYEDVDLLEGDEKDRIDAEIDGYGDDISYPLVVLDGKKFCCGFDEDKIRKKFVK